jgi:hypothetical protein
LYGLVVRHHAVDKGWTKGIAGEAMWQGIVNLVRKEFVGKKGEYWIKEDEG